MLRYFELLTDITPGELARLKEDLAQGGKHPRQVKEELALELVTRYHGKEAALEAAREFTRIFREKGLPEEIKEVALKAARAEAVAPQGHGGRGPELRRHLRGPALDQPRAGSR